MVEKNNRNCKLIHFYFMKICFNV